ncbi:M2 family metallopeptidase [Hydrocarboniphaga sp.]|uniref:M2 family metallopeptidase n=1 Tax=Hydrocarboniphaga sp. TaxID=2033016 RepID=UPI002AB8457A|nr:M2 family metallopeptidase [Hydrocarboniphaga sp.]MDZ4077538.1 M2 family metallopeptidase [Hydrocarboniphaga sp.]
MPAITPLKLSALALATLALSACQPNPQPASPPAPEVQKAIGAADADKFILDINEWRTKNNPRLGAAYWVAATYITDDSQMLAAQATEENLEYVTRKVDEAKRYNGLTGLSPATDRALMLVKLGSTMPAPNDATKREELARIAASMEANYGSGKWCHAGATGQQECLRLQEIEKIIDNVELKNTPQQMAEAWAGWHATAKPIRKDYQRFVELMNEGSKEIGYANTGELWRGGYDMSPAEFDQDVERLWGQLKPLYEQLHCAVRGKLNEKYGDAVVPKDGLIPAQLLGNMWAQQWANLYPLMEPYKGVGSLDVSASLRKLRDAEFDKLKAATKGRLDEKHLAELQHQADTAMAVKMTKIAEDFYTSLGMPKLPETFWTKSLLVQPRDRDVVCHASAWDLDLGHDDVRIKMCIEPTEEMLTTIHHELGHIYYYLAYKDQPSLFQSGAHDGFHEAIGDTITLSLTPKHLQTIGLIGDAKTDERAVINNQMKLALDKITFLPWGKLVDQWRWKVFSGEIAPEHYNEGWWKLRGAYQGVAPPLARTEEDFDPGAKYHVAGNTPYTRYFLAFVLQFQFQKALCDASGFKGPLYECDIYGNAEAGARFTAMLSQGQSHPWQDTLEKLTGTRQMDASALIEYFSPLMKYLEEQNQGKSCGWAGEA